MAASINSSDPGMNISDESLMALLSQLPEKYPELKQAITVQRVLPWDCIAPKEEIADHLYIVVDGLVQILITSKEGRRLVTSVLRPGAVFGEESVFNFSNRGPNYCAQALKPSVLWKIPAKQADDFLIKHSELRLALLRTFGVRLLQVENRLEEVAYRWLPERLAAEIIRQSRYAESNQIRLSHQTLADILGTYRETISAILRDFREAGWVKLGYRRITILNQSALENMAGIVRD
jgi:CRP-like cAMP-binding protein